MSPSLDNIWCNKKAWIQIECTLFYFRFLFQLFIYQLLLRSPQSYAIRFFDNGGLCEKYFLTPVKIASAILS